MKGLVRDYIDIGRNDPCPCGSGKKFKRCCLPLYEESLEVNFLKFSLYYKVAYHSFTNYREAFRDIAKKFDRGDLSSVESFDDLIRNKSDWEEILDWFIFNEYVAKGKTPLQLFLEEDIATEKEKNLLRRFQGTYWSVYEVTDITKELGRARLIDILTSREYLVFDENIERFLGGEVAFGRIIPHDNFYFLGYVFFPWLVNKPEGLESILSQFLDPFLKDGVSVENVLRNYGYRLYIYINGISQHKEEEPRVKISEYEIKDIDKVTSVLQLSPFFVKREDNPRGKIFVCVRNPRTDILLSNQIVLPNEEETEEDLELGVVRIYDDTLDILALDSKRLEAVRSLVEEILGDSITLRETG
ncbi:MAG: SEC-C metal-binding domain-containing protein [bacterium]|nr:SEC-C metal-binding domain-containing protein [bacterium]